VSVEVNSISIFIMSLILRYILLRLYKIFYKFDERIANLLWYNNLIRYRSYLIFLWKR
jgi:hypothetical protein